MKAAISGLALGVFFLIVLFVYYIYENNRRDRVYGSPSHLAESEELAEELSNRTDTEISSFRYAL